MCLLLHQGLDEWLFDFMKKNVVIIDILNGLELKQKKEKKKVRLSLYI